MPFIAVHQIHYKGAPRFSAIFGPLFLFYGLLFCLRRVADNQTCYLDIKSCPFLDNNPAIWNNTPCPAGKGVTPLRLNVIIRKSRFQWVHFKLSLYVARNDIPDCGMPFRDTILRQFEMHSFQENATFPLLIFKNMYHSDRWTGKKKSRSSPAPQPVSASHPGPVESQKM